MRQRPVKLMKSFCSVVLLVIAAVACDAGDTEVISKSATGESSLAIVKDRSDGIDYFFMDTKTGERLGDVLGDLRGARINDIEGSWSADGRKVAVFISYGTRMNTVFVYTLSEDHKMKSVKLPDIDPVEIYDKRNPEKHLSRQAEEAPGYSENAIGDWITNDTVKIVRGDAIIDVEDDERTKHFLVVLEVKIVGDHGHIVKSSPIGVLSNERAESFLNNWKH
jgi:hypothetical protein